MVSTRTIGTQYERPKTIKKHNKQWEKTEMYTKAIKKYWIETNKTTKYRRMLRKILMDVFLDKSLVYTHLKQTGLISILKQIKKQDKCDKEIVKWIKGIFKKWKKQFNKHKIKA